MFNEAIWVMSCCQLIIQNIFKHVFSFTRQIEFTRQNVFSFYFSDKGSYYSIFTYFHSLVSPPWCIHKSLLHSFLYHITPWDPVFTTLFISQSQGGLQEVWVKLICMFVEQISPPWCMKVVEMEQNGENLCKMPTDFSQLFGHLAVFLGLILVCKMYWNQGFVSSFVLIF